MLGLENGDLALANMTNAPDPVAPGEPYAIVKQEVELDINFREKSVSGICTFKIYPLIPDLEELVLDTRQCEIDVTNITVDGYKTQAQTHDPYDRMEPPTNAQIGATQHHIMKKWMGPLLPETRHQPPLVERAAQLNISVPADGSLRIRLRPDALVQDAEPKRILKLKTAMAVSDDTTGLSDSNEEITVVVPFKSKTIRDGLHFVGVEEGDLRYPHVYTRHSLEPGTASCIFPCLDDPGSRHAWVIKITCPRTLGDAFAQPLATQSSMSTLLEGSRKRKASDISTHQPGSSFTEEDKLREITVVCSGNLTGEQMHPTDERKKTMIFECLNTAARHIGFAVGPFEHVDLGAEFRTEEADEKLGSNAARVHGYCLPGRVEEVRWTCQAVVAAADFFAPEFGRYPYEAYKVCFVEDLVHDTTVANSLSLCSTRLLYPETIIDTDIEVTRKLVHALASQYVGVHIVANERSDTWLIIGLQWFMTDLFMKTICGNNWYRFHIKMLSDKLVEADVRRPSLHALGDYLHLGDFELEFMALKAPLVLYILDQRMSKIPGSTGVVRVLSQMVSAANISNTDPKATTLSFQDFRRWCEKRSQYVPDELWDQYVMGAGCPKLDIHQKFNKKNLNVDIQILQFQGPVKKSITKDEFWRELQEEIHQVYAGDVPKLFTGPFTVRIHEADGTPYEHYQLITEKDKGGTNLQIAYNTKYKRLKRTKKAMAAAANSNSDKHEIQEDDVVYFNMLGDVLTSQKDMEDWGLQDWAPEVQTKMDQESYEWIRLDANMEWLCFMKTDMQEYMYLAQLQQDRDVVAHQDAMLAFKREKRHAVHSTVETRTVMDRRYYHGVRVMALEDLAKQAHPDLNYIGMVHLILCFRKFFCKKVPIPGKEGAYNYPIAPNDFTDKGQYAIQCAIPAVLAQTMDLQEKGRCSKRARQFIMEMLLFNDNSENEFSDQFYIAKLLDALTTSVIPQKEITEGYLIKNLDPYDDDDAEFKSFIEKTIEEIDKFRRMDEWTLTYQNIWTTTALQSKMRLMKARVIPESALDFVQYLQDDNIDLVRIKAFECLVELGMISKAPILKLLLSYMSTDSSPFVRDRLFKVFCRGIAAIAFGENKASSQDLEAHDDGGLVIDQGDAEIQQRKLDAVRREDITHALNALKEELKGNTEMQIYIWKAFNSPVIGLQEKRQLLELCSAMFEPEDSLLVTIKYPIVWKATREPTIVAAPPQVLGTPPKKRCLIKFKSEFRTNPKSRDVAAIEAPPAPAPLPALPPSTIPSITAARVEIKPPEKKTIVKLQSRPSFTAKPRESPAPEAPSPVRKESIAVAVPPRPPSTAATRTPLPGSVPSAPAPTPSVAQPVVKPPVPKAASPPPPASAPKSQQPAEVPAPKPSTLILNKSKIAKPVIKRKSDEALEGASPKKIIKTNTDSFRSDPSRNNSFKTDSPRSESFKKEAPARTEAVPKSSSFRESAAAQIPSSRGTSSPFSVRPNANGRPSKVVTVPFRKWGKLSARAQRSIDYEQSQREKQILAASASGVPGSLATPVHKRSSAAVGFISGSAPSSPKSRMQSPAGNNGGYGSSSSYAEKEQRIKDRERDRDREKDKFRDKDRYDSDRERYRAEREKERYRERDRDGDRERDRPREKERERDKDKYRERDRDSERERVDRPRDKYREKGGATDSDRGGRTTDSDRERNRSDRDRDRTDRERERERSDRDRERTDRERERIRDKYRDRADRDSDREIGSGSSYKDRERDRDRSDRSDIRDRDRDRDRDRPAGSSLLIKKDRKPLPGSSSSGDREKERRPLPSGVPSSSGGEKAPHPLKESHSAATAAATANGGGGPEPKKKIIKLKLKSSGSSGLGGSGSSSGTPGGGGSR